jgi:hypothetical protein
MKIYGRMNVRLHRFLTSALHEREQAPSCFSHFTPWERIPGTDWISCWVKKRQSRYVPAEN